MWKDLMKPKLINQIRSIKTKTKATMLIIGLMSLGGSAVGITHYKQKKSEERIAMYMHEIDNVVPVMTNLIAVSDEILKYHEKKSDDVNEWTFNNLSVKLGEIADSLTTLRSNDPTVHDAILVIATLQDVFEKEAQLSIQRGITKAAIQLNSTVDVRSIQDMRMQSMQNGNAINKAEKNLQLISNEFFYSNKVFLTEREKEELSAKILSSFEKTINKYNKSLKSAEDPSKVMMYVYEWAPIYMYLSLNS